MGEFELLARIRERLPPADPRLLIGSGDDAAVTSPAGATATSVDALVDGVHFRRDRARLAQIGHKALATALSDLAAMGAAPGEAYVALGVPDDLGEDECMELLDGLAELAAATGTSLAGGDVTRAPALILTTTVVGHASSPEHFVTRGGAQPGDVLAVTGELGGAAAGLLLLEASAEQGPAPVASGLTEDVRARLIARQLEPQPRLAAGRALADVNAHAMIDLSDGLGGDAGHLARASGVGLRIEAAALPLATGLAELAAATGHDPLQLALSGGEDYELLVALPPGRFEAAREAVAEAGGGLALTSIGEVAPADAEIEIRLPDGGRATAAGFDQLG